MVVNAAGCGAMLKEYGHLLRDDPDLLTRAAAFAARVRDVTECWPVDCAAARTDRSGRCRDSAGGASTVTYRTPAPGPRPGDARQPRELLRAS